MKEVKFPKKREALLKHYHGEDWTEEDQENFVRERNTRHCGNWRNKNRDKYNKVMRRAQDKWRKENPFYYGFIHYKKTHPETTYEWYIAYRKNKERRKGER